jgi:hypothetical protein
VKTFPSIAGRRKGALVSFLAAGLILALAAGCASTRHVKQSEKDFSGFLGDYSQLQPGAEGQANFVYANPSAPWKSYDKVYIRPVQLWQAESEQSSLGSVSFEDKQMLVDYLHVALAGSLSKNFKLVDKAGPGVLVVSAAVTEAGAAKPVVNLLSTVTPVGLVIGAGKAAVTGKSPGVGSVSVEAEFTDGVSGKRVLAVVDSRAGTKRVGAKFGDTWSDVHEAFKFWSEKVNARLVSLKSGN